MIHKYKHLQGIQIEDNSMRNELPIHLILGASEYSRIKLPYMPCIGQSGEPVAALTALGRTIMSPGQEGDYNNMFFAKSNMRDFDQLCSLDVLGIKDKPEQVRLQRSVATQS